VNQELTSVLACVSSTHSQSGVDLQRRSIGFGLQSGSDLNLKVTVTSNIATDLDRGNDLQTSTAAPCRQGPQSVFLYSRENRFVVSLAADKHLTVRSGARLRISLPPYTFPLNLKSDSSLNYPAWTNIRALPPSIWCNYPPALVFHQDTRRGSERLRRCCISRTGAPACRSGAAGSGRWGRKWDPMAENTL